MESDSSKHIEEDEHAKPSVPNETMASDSAAHNEEKDHSKPSVPNETMALDSAAHNEEKDHSKPSVPNETMTSGSTAHVDEGHHSKPFVSNEHLESDSTAHIKSNHHFKESFRKTTASIVVNLSTWAKYTAFFGFGIAFISFFVAIGALVKVNRNYVAVNSKLQELVIQIEEMNKSPSKREVKRESEPSQPESTSATMETINEGNDTENNNQLSGLGESNKTTNNSEQQNNQIDELKNDPRLNVLEDFSSNVTDLEKQINETERLRSELEEEINKLNRSIIEFGETNDKAHEDIHRKIFDLEGSINNSKILRAEQVTKLDLMKELVNVQGVYDDISSNLTQFKSTIDVEHSTDVNQDPQLDSLNDTLSELNELNAQIKLRKDCQDVANQGYTLSRSYNIMVNEKRNRVYCDLHSDGGSWTVMQRRINGAVDFYRDWNSYRNGFGDLEHDFWMGLEMIHAITTSGSYQLHIELEDFSSSKVTALYSTFSVGDESTNYRLTLGEYSGSIGNGMNDHNNQPFSTNDQDNDPMPEIDCPTVHKGGWWYGTNCYGVNLNGRYINNQEDNSEGIFWQSWKNNFQTIKRVVMKFKLNA